MLGSKRLGVDIGEKLFLGNRQIEGKVAHVNPTYLALFACQRRRRAEGRWLWRKV